MDKDRRAPDYATRQMKIRRPNTEIRSKLEIQTHHSKEVRMNVFEFLHSSFLRISPFGIRISKWSLGKDLPLKAPSVHDRNAVQMIRLAGR
jgi:hypothetical protein